MNAKEFLADKGPEESERVAKRAGTNLAYFKQIASGFRKASGPLSLRLERETDGELTRHELRPDIYPEPIAAAG